MFPSFIISPYNTIWNEKKCLRQAFHTDYNNFELGKNITQTMSYSILYSFAEDNYFWYYDEINENYSRFYLPFNSCIIFSGNSIHAGEGYTEDNFRFHRYIEHTTMMHGLEVSQEFIKYDPVTNNLNKAL